MSCAPGRHIPILLEITEAHSTLSPAIAEIAEYADGSALTVRDGDSLDAPANNALVPLLDRARDHILVGSGWVRLTSYYIANSNGHYSMAFS